MKKINDLTVQDILSDKDSLSEHFHNETSIAVADENAIPYEKWPEEWRRIYYKEYPRLKSIKLKLQNTKLFSSGFLNVLRRRRSERNFSDKQIQLKSLGTLLRVSAGINRRNSRSDLALRAWPSAGARYPLEIYVLNRSVQGLEECSYHYNVKRNTLERLFPIVNPPRIFADISGQDWTKNSACLILISSVFGRNQVKYGQRGYRFSLIDCGHLGQNILLTSVALNLKCCAIGGFLDKRVNDLLDLDGKNEAIMYLIAVGR